MKTGLKRTNRKIHMTQYDGLQIDRTIYTDGSTDYIKLNGFVFKLWEDFVGCRTWTINFEWSDN